MVGGGRGTKDSCHKPLLWGKIHCGLCLLTAFWVREGTGGAQRPQEAEEGVDLAVSLLGATPGAPGPIVQAGCSGSGGMWALLGGEGQPGSLERAEGWGQSQRVAQGRGQMSHSSGGAPRRGRVCGTAQCPLCWASLGMAAHFPDGESKAWSMLSPILGNIARCAGAWHGL